MIERLLALLLPHLRYLRYVLRHKLYVYRAGRVLGVGRWQLLVHDLSKFSRAEWGPYVRRFYGGRGGVMDKAADPEEFNQAWAHHWQVNAHHPEHWTRAEEPGVGHRPMPLLYVREMVADWYGAGMAQGKPDCWAYYRANQDRYPFHPTTRAHAERFLGVLSEAGLIPPERSAG
jgi:hypothetical protein